ncbi:Glycosyl transferase family 2 [Jannaschia seohaensis]|uniref:Glycosyl transferase family 2 n=2 Tax=Jannaschia seohaensis TaxID=475081 RepID=A0A2Y9A189_9RHOB|nr:glycosyltransferase family 2 protein [Jannaschia seohaensis]PWJ21777.1 glycosyl transferase family 2 [Jannaschia seohaensis]SSA38055.1 Glycosyl transferase family 2 [Jannaschia seohaensis]
MRKAGRLRPVSDRTARIGRGDLLVFATMRNEGLRLPYWLEHHRGLGADHFLIVDNDSEDGTAEMLAEQPDVSLWSTRDGYKSSRFGVDWLTVLMRRHGHGHWCLTLDADELAIYAHHDSRDLHALTGWLDHVGRRSMGFLMLDLYPQGPLGAARYRPGDDPTDTLPWFDAGNYVATRQPKLQNLWVQGGVRSRVFFGGEPRRGPTLSKVPLIRWHRDYAYVSSTHTVLPRRLNHVYERDGGEAPTGVLLHTKFLPNVLAKSEEEKARRQHFENSDLYQGYYDALIGDPVLWCERSTRYHDWRQLEALGLMSRGGWE